MATHNNQRTRGHKIPTYRTDPRGILPLDSSRKALKPVKYLEISFVVMSRDVASIAGVDQPAADFQLCLQKWGSCDVCLVSSRSTQRPVELGVELSNKPGCAPSKVLQKQNIFTGPYQNYTPLQPSSCVSRLACFSMSKAIRFLLTGQWCQSMVLVVWRDHLCQGGPFPLSSASGFPTRNDPTAGGTSALQYLPRSTSVDWSPSSASRPEAWHQATSHFFKC